MNKISYIIITIFLAILLSFTGCSDSDSDSGGDAESPRTINIAMLTETYPVLNFALSVYDLNSNPTYFAIEQKQILDHENLPDNVYPIPGTDNESLFATVDQSAFVAFVLDEYAKDNTTVFNLHITESMMELIFRSMVVNKIPESNYAIHLYLEGANFAPIDRYTETPYDPPPNPQDYYDYDCSAFQAYKSLIMLVGSRYFEIPDREPIPSGASLAALNYFENIKLYVHNVEAYKNNAPVELKDEIQAFIDNGKLVQRSIPDKVAELKADGHIRGLEYMLKLRWGDSESDSVEAQLNKGNGKKTLLILGARAERETSTVYYDTGAVLFPDYVNKALIDQVRELYNAEYNLFYKGHPENLSIDTALLDFLNIEYVIPTVPAETMMFFYDDVYIGGYPGTTFVSAIDNQAIFAFGPKSVLSAIDGIIMGNFKNTAYIYYDAKGWHSEINPD